MEVENALDSAEKLKRSLLINDRVDDEENLFELEIKNLDTNEVYKMHIPIGSGDPVASNSELGQRNNFAHHYASKRGVPAQIDYPNVNLLRGGFVST